MKQYQVRVEVVNVYSITIKADDPQEAIAKARDSGRLETIDNFEYRYFLDTDEEMDVTEVEE